MLTQCWCNAGKTLLRVLCRTKQMAVSVYFTSKQILPFAYADQYRYDYSVVSGYGPLLILVTNYHGILIPSLSNLGSFVACVFLIRSLVNLGYRVY